MENASKAILIAGGVLVAMVLIGIAAYIWSMGAGAFGSIEESKEATAKEEALIKFSQYSGELYGSEVQNCIRRVLTYNQIYGTNMQVYINTYPNYFRVGGVSGSKYQYTFTKLSEIIQSNAHGTYTTIEIFTGPMKNDLYTGKLIMDNDGYISKIEFTLKQKK